MISKIITTSFIVSISLLAGCASHPDKIKPTYVSPHKYAEYNCDQIVDELNSIDQRTSALYETLKQKRANDSTQMTVGMLFFWPTLLFLEGGDGPEAAEYAQLQGDYIALRNNAIEKECSYTGKSPEEILKEHEAAEKVDAEVRKAEPKLP